jgi:ribosome-binding protein aMBF1 (putative translation factor)
MPDPIQPILLPFRAVHAAAARPAAEPVGDIGEEEMRDLLAFYGLAGLDWSGIEVLTRLADIVETCRVDYVAVRRADLDRLLTWVDQAARDRRREIPTLRISDADYDYVVGRHIRAAREARGLSHADMAAALGAGQAWVSGIEHARPRPSVRLVRRIAAVLSVPIGSLVTEWEALDDEPA